MEIITENASKTLEIQLTLHQIFIFWYAIMVGTMLATIGARPKENRLPDLNEDSKNIKTKREFEDAIERLDEDLIKKIDNHIDLQNWWKRKSPKKGVDRLVEGLMSFETVEMWETINEKCGIRFSKNDYKIPDPKTKRVIRYPQSNATIRIVLSIILLNLLPIFAAFLILRLVIPAEIIWTGNWFVFLAVSLPAFIPFQIYRLYWGVLYWGRRLFYGNDWQGYFQLGLASRPVIATRPANHVFPAILLTGLYLIPSVTLFKGELFRAVSKEYYLILGAFFILLFLLVRLQHQINLKS